MRGRLVSALLVVLVSCGSDDSGERMGDAKETTPTAPVTTAAPSPATTPTESSGCPSGVGAGPADADQAARCLERAWQEASRSDAEIVASVDVVDALFGTRWSPPDGTLLPCVPDPHTDGTACRYEYHGAVYVFGVRPSEGGWRVTRLQKPSTE